MRDMILAVYRKECYAGETMLRLVGVFLLTEELPKQYLSDEYVLKAMCLEAII